MNGTWPIALMIDAVITSETSVCSTDTTRRYIPEDSNLIVVTHHRFAELADESNEIDSLLL
jgi:hypothetical protein